MSAVPATVAAPGTPVVAEGPGALLSAIMQLARDPSVDVVKLTALLEMQERMEARQAEALFTQALQAAQNEMPRVAKNGTVKLGEGKGSYAFATWEDMDTALRPIMQRHDFSLSFDTAMKDGGGIVVTGTLQHSAGHARKASIPLALDTGAGRNNLQAMGSSLSYGKRYVAEMLFNIVRSGHDDDGKMGGMRFITDEQAMQIEGLLKETRADRTSFMRHFGVESLLEIETKNFTAVINSLNTKKAQQKRGTGP